MASVRWMIRRDLERVVEIERLSYASPWQEEDFLNALRQRNVIGGVVEERAGADYLVVGFMIYELSKWNLRVLNLAVHPNHRGCGFGRTMVDKLKSKLALDSYGDRRFLNMEVDEGNLSALQWLKHQGFVATKVLRGVSDDGADAIVMSYHHVPIATSPIEA